MPLQSGHEEHLDVIPYGDGPPSKRLEKAWRDESTIQDWHPTYPRFRSSRTLPYIVAKDGDPLLYERYLYSCRWRNPQPSKPLVCIRFRSLLPDARATVAILAITLEVDASS